MSVCKILIENLLSNAVNVKINFFSEVAKDGAILPPIVCGFVLRGILNCGSFLKYPFMGLDIFGMNFDKSKFICGPEKVRKGQIKTTELKQIIPSKKDRTL